MSYRTATLRERALDALADPRQCRSMSAIAGDIGVSLRTLSRWKSSAHFQTELRARMPHAPASAQSDGTRPELPEDSGALLAECMRELRAIGTDQRTPAYARVGALRALADLVVEHKTIGELEQQLAELREGG